MKLQRASHQCLHHVGSLQSEALDCLEDVQDALCLHPLQDCTQCTESPCPASTSTAHTKCKLYTNCPCTQEALL